MRQRRPLLLTMAQGHDGVTHSSVATFQLLCKDSWKNLPAFPGAAPYPAGVEFRLTVQAQPMPTTHHICRLAAVEDIRRTTPLWAPDRPLFDADVWARMPALLSELLQSELVKLAIIESVPARQPRLLGAVSFIEPEYVAEALASGSTLPNTVMRAALDGRHPFLSPEQIAQINPRAELHLMNFFGNIGALDLRKQEMANFYEVSNRGYYLLHYG